MNGSLFQASGPANHNWYPSIEYFKEAIMQSIKMAKLDAARRQLETAIALFFDNGDPVAIHTLACAAYDVIDNVNHSRGGKEMFVKRRYTRLPGRLSRGALNSVQNFFKHADIDPEGELEFFPEMTEPIMADACNTYIELTGESVALFHCMVWWFKSREGAEGFDFPHERRGFLQELLALFARGDRPGFLLRCAAG